MSWLGEKVVENTLWVGDQGAWAQFRATHLLSRHEMRAVSRGIPRETPGRLGLAALLPIARGAGHMQSGLGSEVVSPERAKNPHPWGGKGRWDFSWGRNRTPPAGNNGSESLNNPSPVDEGTQHPGDRRVKSAPGKRVLI